MGPGNFECALSYADEGPGVHLLWGASPAADRGPSEAARAGGGRKHLPAHAQGLEGESVELKTACRSSQWGTLPAS